MTAADLISQLSELDPDSAVLVRTQEGPDEIDRTVELTAVLRRNVGQGPEVVLVGDLDEVEEAPESFRNPLGLGLV